MNQASNTSGLMGKVLAPLALSPRAAAVACEAARWAKVLGAELVLLHVGKDEPAMRSRFDELLREHGLAGHPLIYASGKPGKVIVRTAREMKADLIVAGALENEGALQYYVGSVARQVARAAHCSVLLLTEPRVEARPTSHWVVTARMDESGRSMLRFLRGLMEREKPARVEVVSEYKLAGLNMVLEGDLDSRASQAGRLELQRQEQDRLADFLSEADFLDAEVRTVCLAGRVGFESAEYARSQGADLLIAPVAQRLGFWDKFIQHGVEFALESLPCALWLHRPNQ